MPIFEYTASYNGETFRRLNTRKLKYVVLGVSTKGAAFAEAWCDDKPHATRMAHACRSKGYARAVILPLVKRECEGA